MISAEVLSVLFVLFLSGFVGDIGTQLFAKISSRAELFRDYWEKYGRIGAAAVAGLITLLFGGIIFLVSWFIFDKIFQLDTKSWSFVFFSVSVGFILGVIFDLTTNRRNWIPTLRKWYDHMGETDASLWSGGLTFSFVAFLSSLTWKFAV